MAFGDKQREINQLQAENARIAENASEFAQENRTLRIELEMARAALQAMPQIEKAVKKFYDNPLIIELATNMARDQVIAEEYERILGEATESLKTRHGEEYRADYLVAEGPNIIEELGDLFTTDGTYDNVEEKAKTDVRTEIQAELIKERKAIIKQELSTPEAKAAFIAEIMDTVLNSPELKKFRKEVRDDLETQWTGEATTAAREQISVEETAREVPFKEEFTESYLKGREGSRVRRDKRDSLEREWRGVELPVIVERIGDEELMDLLRIRADQEKRALRAEVHAKELLDQFEGTGIKMQEIDAGTRLELYLGTTEKAKEDPYAYGATPDSRKVELVCDRKISLIAQGDGRFIVDEDTLASASLEYVRDNSLEHGTVAMFGRKVTENGESHLDPSISADVRLFYDTNTTNPEITDAYLSVANVVINGVSARLISKIRFP